MQQYSFIFSDERKHRLQRHFSFWAFWWLFQAYLYSFTPTPQPYPFIPRFIWSSIESLIFLVPHMFLSYSLMYFVVPSLLLKNKYVLTAFWVSVLFLLTAAFSALLSFTVINEVRDWLSIKWVTQKRARSPETAFFISLLAGLRGGITIGGLAAAIKIMKYWYRKEQRNMQLQKENAASQLQLLKAQVHPHFLFNTLNNIYSFTQNTSPVASKLVMGLSEMLRYMLYEGNQPLVPLSREITMIREYIGLEKIRYGNKLDLYIDLPDSTRDLYIAPLLLLPFVENCFKHGTSNMLEQPWLNLGIMVGDNIMTMKLMNGKCPAEATNPKPGIGIRNASSRLELLYPGKHELSLTNERDVFIVNLKLELERKQSKATEGLQKSISFSNA